MSLLGADAADVFQLLLKMADAAGDLAAVGFQLGFARAAGANAAAQLGHLDAVAGKARHHVMQLRQFDLQLAFAGARVAREDVKDELRTIDHPAMKDLFDIALLGRAEIVIEKENVGIHGCGSARDFLEFSGADERCRIGAIAPLQDFAHDFGSRALRQGAEFG